MGCASSVEEIPTTTNPAAVHDGKTFPVVGDKSIMKKKAHGTSATPVQKNLRWSCNFKEADKICNFNRHFAERAGAFHGNSWYVKEYNNANKKNETITFYDSNTGNLLFEAGSGGRSLENFWNESGKHGWPSFRDQEVNWEFVRCLPNGECVSLHGTHLGHNLPDKTGNRYCINLVSIAGLPPTGESKQ